MSSEHKKQLPPAPVAPSAFEMSKILGFHLVLSLMLLLSASASSMAQDVCEHEIVESMPDKMEFNTTLSFKPTLTHEALLGMIENSKSTLKIASFYWSLSAEPEQADDPTTEPGKRIMDSIIAAVERGVSLEVILDKSTPKQMSSEADIEKLESLGVVKYLNMKALLGAGVLHSKFLIADNESIYVGSSNFDWRSYTQIKEIGIAFTNCRVLADDLDKMFRTYKLISDSNQLPKSLPEDLETEINIDHPINLKLGDLNANLFIAGAPPPFNGLEDRSGRTDDIDALLDIIQKAEEHIDISVMNYSPRTEFIWPKKYWPTIDNALRQAAIERNVRVRLLFSEWSQSRSAERMWYKSLNDIQSESLKGGIFVRMFKVPADESQQRIPYARVKHDKYMVTDNALFIGTSNWTPDYFINTCGASVIIKPVDKDAPNLKGSVIGNMQELFERDFTSKFSHEL